jgi:phenylacetic acid degradation operon negative regulatory protein
LSQSRNSPDERPLTARSVIASTLLGTHPPVLPVRVLVRSGELFGIADGAIRVALSRMAAAGEVVAEGDGRYRLAGRLLGRQERQDQARRPRLRRWNGDWVVAAVPSGSRTPEARSDLRRRMGELRMAELREGVWMRPDNLGTPRVEGCTWLVGRPEQDLAGTLWDLDGWAARARDLVRRMGRQGTLAADFVLSAAVLRHFNADPLLPPRLLPDDWPGEALRAAYDEFDTDFRRRWRAATRF